MAAALRRQLAGLSARASDGDTAPLVELQALAGEIDAALAASVSAARAAGHTWASIGGELGMTRQAAQQRWTPKLVKL